jgi:hypothetical protein
VSAFVLDAGALIAIDRNDRSMVARLAAAQCHGIELRTNAMVISQVWRHPGGRQARLGQLLRAVDVRAVNPQDGRDAGVLLGSARTSDPIDATVVLIAGAGDRILTSDLADLTELATVAGRRVIIISC